MDLPYVLGWLANDFFFISILLIYLNCFSISGQTKAGAARMFGDNAFSFLCREKVLAAFSSIHGCYLDLHAVVIGSTVYKLCLFIHFQLIRKNLRYLLKIKCIEAGV